LDFRIVAHDGAARAGVVALQRGAFHTPAFMPVGTAGTVKALTTQQVAAAGAEILLGNTYHLMLRPTAERVARLGGLHAFMRWPGPILTDSGGFQVMSLSKISKVDDDAVTFQSHIDGARHVLSPERSIEIQADLLGSDIVMQLDECIHLPADTERAGAAMRRSARWAARCKAAFGQREAQALFGIQQGGLDAGLRAESAQRLAEIGFDGYAIGGLAVGEGHQAMCEALDFAPAMLPPDRPRYLMGVGKPIDIVEAVWRGVDMFDCVLPTRSGRHGQAWTARGAVNLKNARFADDPDPLDPASDCPASRDYSKAYLHHLVKSGEILGQVLLSWHNLAFFETLMAQLREAIAQGRLAAYRREFKARAAAEPASQPTGLGGSRR
jgi:queuine tRNA-ribosyltransferase